MKIKITGRVKAVAYGEKAHRATIHIETIDGFKLPIPKEGRSQSGDLDDCVLADSDGNEYVCDAVIVANDKGGDVPVMELKLSTKAREGEDGTVEIPAYDLPDWARDNHGQSVDLVLRHGTADMFTPADGSPRPLSAAAKNAVRKLQDTANRTGISITTFMPDGKTDTVKPSGKRGNKPA